jgi:hypothetical protein
MNGRDDRDAGSFDDDEDRIDRDDDAAPEPLVDRDDDEPAGAPGRAFPEERDYPDLPDWQDESVETEADLRWNPPPSDNDDLNRLAAEDLDELGEDPFAETENETRLPPMDPDFAADRDDDGFSDRDDPWGTADDPYDSEADRGPDMPSDDALTAAAPQPARSERSLAAAAAAVSPPATDTLRGDAPGDFDDDYRPEENDYRAEDEDAFAEPAPAREGRAADASTQRRWPMLMLGVAALAVVLLAVGGYGVLSERAAQQKEIRSLQAQLATAVSPEEARASRDAAETARAEAAELGAERDALREEVTALEATVRELETQVASLEDAASEAAEAQAKTASATRESSATGLGAAAGAGRSAAATAQGDWFVNFSSYAQEAAARRWAERLAVDSGRVVVQDARSNGRTLYRVRVVGLPDRDAAERVARRLEDAHDLPRLWVGRE